MKIKKVNEILKRLFAFIIYSILLYIWIVSTIWFFSLPLLLLLHLIVILFGGVQDMNSVLILIIAWILSFILLCTGLFIIRISADIDFL